MVKGDSCRTSHTLLLVNLGIETVRDSRTLASSLAPLIIEACERRLHDITWFKTDWQRGGAATGKAIFKLDDGTEFPVVLKLPVVQRELLWTQRLQNIEAGHWRAAPHNGHELPIAPRLFACGETIGGYDLAWIVIEHFPSGPLGLHWHDDHIVRICEAAAHFHKSAAQYEIDQVPTAEPWETLLAEASESVRVNNIDHRQRWSAAMKSLRHRAGSLVREWNNRAEDQWLHGDLHFANAMSRADVNAGPLCLIDLAEVHAGHWIEDAIYLERQLWAMPHRLKVHKPVKALAAARRKLGLAVDGDHPRLAMIRRAMLAGTAPRFIKSEGHPAYLEACLHWLEIALNELK